MVDKDLEKKIGFLFEDEQEKPEIPEEPEEQKEPEEPAFTKEEIKKELPLPKGDDRVDSINSIKLHYEEGPMLEIGGIKVSIAPGCIIDANGLTLSFGEGVVSIDVRS